MTFSYWFPRVRLAEATRSLIWIPLIAGAKLTSRGAKRCGTQAHAMARKLCCSRTGISGAVYEPTLGPLLFIADVHLGALGRFLRMLGFDTVHEPHLADADIRRLAHAEDRIVLTRDRDLLKCRDVARGCYVRTLKPEAQLREVVARYGLAD